MIQNSLYRSFADDRGVLFRRFDSDGTGRLSPSEFSQGLESIGHIKPNAQELKLIFSVKHYLLFN